MSRSILFLTAAILCATSAGAADLKSKSLANVVAVPPTVLPAVSGINGSIEAAGGYVKGASPLGSGGYGHLGGTLSLPVSQQFGVQVDGLAATIDGLGFLGVGGHGFWRNPATGLVGLYGEALTADVGTDRLNKGRLGVEAEYYMDRMTFSGLAGYEFGNLDIRKGAFVETLAGYFAHDDLKISAGYSYGFAGNMGVARVDWQLPASNSFGNVTLFAEGRIGEGDYKSIIAGVKVPFGAAPKSLKARERQDDPPAWIHSQPSAVAAAKAQGQFNKNTDVCPALMAEYADAYAAYREFDGVESEEAFAARDRYWEAREAADAAGCRDA